MLFSPSPRAPGDKDGAESEGPRAHQAADGHKHGVGGGQDIYLYYKELALYLSLVCLE